MRRILFSLFLIATLGACSTTPHDPTEGWSARQLYEAAKEELEAGNFQQAIEYFETLEARFPFGDYALQTQLEIAYAYYKYGETDSAIAAIDRFVKLNPRHERIDYAYYLRGLANYTRSRSLFESYFPKNMALTDQRVLQQAFNDFAKVVEFGPNSEYAVDARQRMIYLRNKMAENGILTAEYYARRGALVAAARRLNQLLSEFPETPHTPSALALLADVYTRLGIEDLATDTRRVLAANEPGAAPQMAEREQIQASN